MFIHMRPLFLAVEGENGHFYNIERESAGGAEEPFAKITIAFGGKMRYSNRQHWQEAPPRRTKKWMTAPRKCWLKSTKINLPNVLQ